jgi:transposase
MKRKRTYTTVDVERFDVTAVQQVLTVGCIVAVDVAKTKFVAALAKGTGEVVRLVRFQHPQQTAAFLRVLVALQDAKLEPRVVMEPTGTYGDALRYQCHKRGLPVHMASPKHTHDFAEVLDGVPSMHDPKAAMTLAQLAVIKPGKPWIPPSNERRDLRALLDRRGPVAQSLEGYHGHLEAMLARHWPEFGRSFDVHEQRSWMTLLKQYPGPQSLAAEAAQAAETLRVASRGRFASSHIAGVVDGARTTLGVPMTTGERAKLVSIVEAIEQRTRELDEVDGAIATSVEKDKSLSLMASVVGPACAAAVIAYVGSPTEFPSATALEKAMGLNLKVKSSGETRGECTIHITKRGPAQVRQLLFLATLRQLQDPFLGAWYRARRSYGSPSGKMKAVVAVMRKLARALWHVARGVPFDPTKLVDVRRLDLDTSKVPQERPASPRPATQKGKLAPQPIA